MSWTCWCRSVTQIQTKSPLCSGPLPSSDTSTTHMETPSKRSVYVVYFCSLCCKAFWCDCPATVLFETKILALEDKIQGSVELLGSVMLWNPQSSSINQLKLSTGLYHKPSQGKSHCSHHDTVLSHMASKKEINMCKLLQIVTQSPFNYITSCCLSNK